MKIKLLVIVVIVFIMTACTKNEQKEEINALPIPGDFILGYHDKSENSFLIGRNMETNEAELHELLDQTPDELLLNYNYNLFWLEVSDLSSFDEKPPLGSQIRIIDSSNTQLDTIPPTIFAEKIEIIK